MTFWQRELLKLETKAGLPAFVVFALGCFALQIFHMPSKMKWIALLTLMLGICPVHARDVAVHAGVSVTDQDMRAALASIPESQRQLFSKSENSARNLAMDLLVRRVIAERARSEGLNKDAELANRLRLIEERALYEIYLDRKEKAELKGEVLEALAREEYRANPERFRHEEQVRARHILVRPQEGDKDAARAKAEAILARLKAGEDFAKLAEETSDDPGSRVRGGDLGYFQRGKMVKPFDEAVFSMTEPSQLSEIVETDFGFHVIRFEGRRPAGAIPFEEVREGLIEAARRRLAGEVRRGILSPIRDVEGAVAIDADALRDAVGASW